LEATPVEVQTRSVKVEKKAQELVQAEPQAGAAAQPPDAAEAAPQDQVARWDWFALKVFVLCFLILVGCHLVELVRHLLWGE
jgi:hypothetical protein